MQATPTERNTTMFDQIADAETKNSQLYKLMAAQRETRGFTVTSGGGGSKLHAARSTTKGHGGYMHPRPLCQNSTTSFYHAPIGNQDAPVTCKRCLASLTKIAAAA